MRFAYPVIIKQEATSFITGAKRGISQDYAKNTHESTKVLVLRIGILTAIPEEIRPFKKRDDSGIKVARKTLFLIPHPKHQVFLVEGGLGKVNSAVTTTLMIREHGVELIIFSGIAGALDTQLRVGQVCFGERLIQYDYGTQINGCITVYPAGSIPLGKPGKIAYILDPEISNTLRTKMPELSPATIVSGDNFLQCSITRMKLHKEHNAQLVDMESAPTAQAATLFGIPVLALRSVSDQAGNKNGSISLSQIKKAAQAAAESTVKILGIL